MTPAQKLKRLGDTVRQARTNKGLSQPDVHKKTGMSVSYLSDIERGYVNPKRGPVIPSDEILETLAEALGINVIVLHDALGRIEEITYDPDPDFAVIREAYDNADSDDRQFLTQAARRVKAAQDAARAGAIGRRQE